MTVFTPRQIAELVTPAGETVFAPTPEQEAIITAPRDQPMLVVAGAGSGKTETMSQRVVWLIANGYVTPSEVLGLTFTRKAAGELAERIRAQLKRLLAALPSTLSHLDDAQATQVRGVIVALEDDFARPTVSTYNAFAGTILAEYGEAAGFNPDAVIIDDATAWRIAREVVNDSHDPRLLELDLEPGPLIDQVLKFSRAMRENLTTEELIATLVRDFVALRDLDYDERTGSHKNQPHVADATAAIEKLPLLSDLARQYAAVKQRRGVLEFSDQVAIALEIVRSAPEVGDVLRSQFSVVLLDEYQDTSVGQTTLLSTLFRHHGVMAVGDPHQSIYGWRGASASNLAEFPGAFCVTHSALSLSTSWRNARVVLDAANALVEPLSRESRVSVTELHARPGAPQGAISVSYERELHDEAASVASWLHEKRESFYAQYGRYPTCAVVMRRRALMGYFSSILTQARVPNEIVGVGGLLTSPEITDLISALRCIWRVDAGSELIRLLVGPRWRIGVADLRQLRELASWLGRRDHAFQSLTDDERDAQRSFALPSTEVTIVEALDVLTTLGREHIALAQFSEIGLERLREAGEVLAQLRSRTANLRELVRQIEAELRLDIELVANETTVEGTGHRARANLDAFYELVDTFTSIDDEGTLPSFLAWLDRAVRDDAAAEQNVEPDPSSVQIITVHGAKGLEWDYVAIPRLVADEFPSKPQSLRGWFTVGELPYELRGDSESLPHLAWRSVRTKREFKQRYETFVAELREHHAAEERRLIYVAVTRAKEELLLTGSFWAGQANPRGPSVFLSELSESELIPELPSLDAAGEQPDDTDASRLSWPLDPLGGRRQTVTRAADAVRRELDNFAEHAVSQSSSNTAHDTTHVRDEIRVLLAERDREKNVIEAPIPERITASTFKDFVTQPDDIRRRLRRPVPERPYRQAKIGTLFHQWVERRYGTPFGSAEMLDLEDSTWGDERARVSDVGVDAEPEAQQLEKLQRSFESSPWGDRQPLELEREITLSFAGRRLVCKIDAVYANPDGSVEIVDWKTGAAPTSSQEQQERMLQLELYRYAFAAWKGIEPELVSCALFYVSTGDIIRAEHRRTFEELEALWLAAALTLQGETQGENLGETPAR